MASTIYSAEMTILNAKVAGSGAALEPYQLGGRVRVARFTYSSVITAGVTLALARLPKGSTVVGGNLQISTLQGSSATFSMGVEDADGGTTYNSTTAIKPAAVYNTLANSPVAIGTYNAVPFTEDVNITLTVAVADSTAGTIYGNIYYVDKMG